MKAALLLIVGTLFLTVAQVQADTPISVIVQPEQIFVMNGFDDNDNVELIVSGYLPTLCHQAPTLKQRVEGHDVLLTLTALYFDQSNPFCTQIPIPFLEVINLGMLEAGEYKVTVNRDTPYESSEFLHIAPAPTHEQNSFTYAQVEYIEKEIGTRNIILAGTNPSNCFELDRTVFMSNEKNAIAVLPILKKTSEDCAFVPTAFKYKIEVPKVLEKDKILLHVRRMDGKSVNTLFNNRE